MRDVIHGVMSAVVERNVVPMLRWDADNWTMIEERVSLEQGLPVVEQTPGLEKFRFGGELHLEALAAAPDDRGGYRSPAVFAQRVEVQWRIQQVKKRLLEFAPSEVWKREKARGSDEL